MKKMINMGCGKRNFGKNWIHIDKANYEHIDEKNIFNFSYNNVDLIYASHLISYFDLSTTTDLLTYWKSKLKKNGILRLAVPDFKIISKLYLEGNSLKKFIGPLYGRMELNEEKIFHKFCYDEEILSELLEKIGFKNIRRWDHNLVCHGNFDDHSQAYLPHMDKENGTLISLNLECDN
tara:strand:+ start:464 stop:997 length:534 start_codon:yes stop_codon:yes gene_type:complete